MYGSTEFGSSHLWIELVNGDQEVSTPPLRFSLLLFLLFLMPIVVSTHKHTWERGTEVYTPFGVQPASGLRVIFYCCFLSSVAAALARNAIDAFA